ncbi:MAG: trigger factor, partial [Methylococcaceae bacterium]
MQVSVETTSELGRKLIVEIPEQRVQDLVAPRLNDIARDVKMDGFRPGKVPMHIVKRQFGIRVREEVVNELFQSSLDDALKQVGMQPVTQLEIQSHQFDDGMKYEAHFEILPEFVLMPLESMDLIRYIPEISDRDVDDSIERLRNLQETWMRQDRPAEMGDRVIVNFEGWAEKESVTDGRVENYPVNLGGAEKIPGFDEHLVGQSANSHVEFDVRFPEDYPKPDMAGKIINFRVDINRVETRQIPEINAEWIKSLGVEDGELESLKKNFRQELEREMKVLSDSRTKTSVMDALCATNPIVLPEALVKNELEAALKALQTEAEQKNAVLDEAAAIQAYTPQARRRVQLSILIGHLVEIYSIQVEKQHIEAKLA